MKTFHWIFFHLITTAVITTEEKCRDAKDSGGTCTHLATVRDFHGLDGCNFLLVLDTDQKLLALNLDTYPMLKDGDRVRLSYQKEEHQMSICMAEDFMARITCLAIQTGSGWKELCPKMLDPYAIEWSEKVMDEIQATKVESLTLDGASAYRFTGGKTVRMYNCDGQLICDDRDKCDDIMTGARDVRVIFVLNEKKE